MTSSSNFFSKTITIWAGALVCCLLWGSAFPCIKIGYTYAGISSNDTASQILYAGMRFFLAGIFAIILGSLLQKKLLFPKKTALPKICLLSLFQTILQYALFYIGLAHTTGAKASVIDGMNVFVSIIIAALFFHQEKITKNKIIGCIIGFLGVILINFGNGGMTSGFSVMGEGFIFLSAVSYAFSSVIIKIYSKSENPVMLSGYQFIVGGFAMILIGKGFGGNVSIEATSSIMMLLYLGLVSAVAYSLWGTLLKYNPVSKVAVFGFMTPVFGFLLSALLLREGSSIGLTAILALILVSLGIYFVNLPSS